MIWWISPIWHGGSSIQYRVVPGNRHEVLINSINHGSLTKSWNEWKDCLLNYPLKMCYHRQLHGWGSIHILIRYHLMSLCSGAKRQHDQRHVEGPPTKSSKKKQNEIYNQTLICTKQHHDTCHSHRAAKQPIMYQPHSSHRNIRKQPFFLKTLSSFPPIHPFPMISISYTTKIIVTQTSWIIPNRITYINNINPSINPTKEALFTIAWVIPHHKKSPIPPPSHHQTLYTTAPLATTSS